MRVIVAGGGTGGHISPSLAVIEALEKKADDLEVLYIGSKEGIENTLIPKLGISFENISTGKLRRYHKSKILNIVNPLTVFKNISDLFKVIRGIFESIGKIRKFKPNAIFLKGGYVSVPVGIAAKFLGIPFVLHESDVVPGLSNRVLGKYASAVCVSFPEKHYKGFFSTAVINTGNPIRKELAEGGYEDGLERFGLDRKLPVIMVIGGSQGAHRLNELIVGTLEDLLHKYQLIHVTGERDYDWVDFIAKKQLDKELAKRYRYFDFISSDLKDAYKVSDLIISRAGCNVLTEIAAAKKPSILVPLSTSTGNHQYENALVFSRDGASYVMDETEIESGDIMHQVDYLMENKEEREAMSEKASKFYNPNAAMRIAEEIIKIRVEKGKANAKKEKKAGE